MAGHPEIFAIGDMANQHDLPGLCEPAMQEGWYVAKLIRREVTGGRLPGSFRYRDLGVMATIAEDDVVAATFGVELSGIPAKIAWGTVHIAFLVGWGNRLGVLSRWRHDALTRQRPERVILTGVGGVGALAELARRDELSLPHPEGGRRDEASTRADGGAAT